MSHTRHRINNLMGYCYGRFDLSAQDAPDILLYIDVINIVSSVRRDYTDITPKIFDDLYSEYIQGACILVEVDDVTEVTSLCIPTPSRGYGITKKLIGELIRSSASETIVIGVDPLNPLWYAAMYAYTGVGLRATGEVTDISPYTGINYDMDVIFMSITINTEDPTEELIASLPSAREKRDTREEINQLREDYLASQHIRSDYVYLPKQLLVRMKDEMLDKEVEMGGAFGTKKMQGDMRVFGVPRESLVSGDRTDYAVRISLEHEFSWHTHPMSLRTDVHIDTTIPSSHDITYVLNMYMNSYAKGHFVITLHGVYQLSLTYKFMWLLDYLVPRMSVDQGEELKHLVYDYFVDNLNVYHGKDTTTLDREILQRIGFTPEVMAYETSTTDIHNAAFLTFIEDLTLDNLQVYRSTYPNAFAALDQAYIDLGWTEDTFPLYHVQLHTWKDIHKNNGIRTIILSSLDTPSSPVFATEFVQQDE